MEFRKWLEQGTGASATGMNAAGRAGESPVAPANPQMADINPQDNLNSSKKPRSAFNVSDKLQTNNKRPASNMSPGTQPNPVPPASNMSPPSTPKSGSVRGGGIGQPQQFGQAQNNANSTVQVPSPDTNIG